MKFQNSLEYTGFLGSLEGLVEGWALEEEEEDDSSLLVCVVFSSPGSAAFTALIDCKRRGFRLEVGGNQERHEKELWERTALKAMEERAIIWRLAGKFQTFLPLVLYSEEIRDDDDPCISNGQILGTKICWFALSATPQSRLATSKHNMNSLFLFFILNKFT